MVFTLLYFSNLVMHKPKRKKALRWFASKGRRQVPEQKSTSTLLIALPVTHDILSLTDHGLTPMPTQTCDVHWKAKGKKKVSRSNALIPYIQGRGVGGNLRTHACKRTHTRPHALTHKPPAAAGGRVNRALIKP